MGLPREGTKTPRPWQNRDMVNNVLRSIKRHVRQAQLRPTAPVNVHTFHKSFGQNHADKGTPLHVLQQLMGHSSITTTRAFYLRVSQGSEREAVARYEQLLSEASDAGRSDQTDARMTPEHQINKQRWGPSIGSC